MRPYLGYSSASPASPTQEGAGEAAVCPVAATLSLPPAVGQPLTVSSVSGGLAKQQGDGWQDRQPQVRILKPPLFASDSHGFAASHHIPDCSLKISEQVEIRWCEYPVPGRGRKRSGWSSRLVPGRAFVPMQPSFNGPRVLSHPNLPLRPCLGKA